MVNLMSQTCQRMGRLAVRMQEGWLRSSSREVVAVARNTTIAERAVEEVGAASEARRVAAGSLRQTTSRDLVYG